MSSVQVGHWMQVSSAVPNGGLAVYAQPSKSDGQQRAHHHHHHAVATQPPVPVGYLHYGDYVKFESVEAPRGWGKLEPSVVDAMATHPGMHKHTKWKCRIADGGQGVSADTSNGGRVFRAPRDKWPLRRPAELDEVLQGELAGVEPRVHVVRAVLSILSLCVCVTD